LFDDFRSLKLVQVSRNQGKEREKEREITSFGDGKESQSVAYSSQLFDKLEILFWDRDLQFASLRDERNGDERDGDERDGDERDGDERDGDERNGDERNGDERNGDERDGDERNGDERNGDERNGDERNGDERDGDERDGKRSQTLLKYSHRSFFERAM